jgi:peptidoglycan/LPS O-acetylase OafA/YrhL
MFGSLRFLLAYLVIVSHLVGTHYVAHLGFYAVRGFFVISGFLMTAALNEVYAFDGVRFWTNRALRLLPPYYFVCGLTLVAIWIAPAQAAAYLKFWRVDPQFNDLLANLTVLPLQLTYTTFRLVPPFWSVAIEIDMYLLLFLTISRRMEWATLALVTGLSFQLAWVRDSMSWSVNYFTAPAAIFPFAIGAVLYFLRKRNLWIISPRLSACAFLGWIANMLAGGTVLPESYIFGLGYFLDTACFAVLVSGLSGLPKQSFGPIVERIDQTLGELAYFAFLVHWLCGFIVVCAFHSSEQRGWLLLLSATPVLLVASSGLAGLNRKYLEPLRDVVRKEHEGFARTASAVVPATSTNPRHLGRP